MNRLKLKILPLIPLIFAGMMKATPQDAASILNTMDNIIFSPKDKQAKVTIILTDRAGKEKLREATLMQKGPDKKLYRYTKPESQAGIATLSLSDDVMWLYMPAFEKPKKISMLAKGQAFNGTDFSNEDMVTSPYSERYTPFLLQTTTDAFMLKLIPKSTESSYSQVVVRINKANGYPEKMEFYNTLGKKFKEATYNYEKIGKYWNAAEVVMKDLEKMHSTNIRLTEVKFDQGLTDELFLVENLKPAENKKEN
jgi:outer membrane lipoprotein-sorting protein